MRYLCRQLHGHIKQYMCAARSLMVFDLGGYTLSSPHDPIHVAQLTKMCRPVGCCARPPYALIITTFLRPRKGEVRTYLVCRESCAATTKTNRQNVVDFQCAKRRFANCQSATCREPFGAGAVFPDTPPTNSHPSYRAPQCEQCGQLVITG